MNMAETYLLRGEKQKAADMLAAALNHSYTTNVWKEEILVDVDAPRACDTPHSKRANMEGTGDMPEAWANANLVLLLRDMLLNERDGKLHLLAGPACKLGAGRQNARARQCAGDDRRRSEPARGTRRARSSGDSRSIRMALARDFVLHLPDSSTVALAPHRWQASTYRLSGNSIPHISTNRRTVEVSNSNESP